MSSIIFRSLPLVIELEPGESPARGVELYMIAIVMVAVAGLFVAARIMTRVLLSSGLEDHGLGKDDFCIILALVSRLNASVEIQS